MYIVGIDIGGTSVKMGVLDAESGVFVHKDSIDTGKLTAAEMATKIGRHFKTMNEKFGGEIAAAGVVSAGLVQPDKGIVTANNLGWIEQPIGSLLQQELGVPVALDNDVQGALYGEYKMGICKGLSSAVYLTLGTGIGGAFIFNGQLFRGVRNEGGEIGHLVTHADGEECACGGKGCWEVYASATALKRYAGGVSPQEIFARVKEGDAEMKAVLKHYVHELCIGLASLNSMLRPEMIVIGGGLSGAGSALLDPIMKELTMCSPSIPNGAVPNVRLASRGNDAGMLGAALIAKDRLLNA